MNKEKIDLSKPKKEYEKFQKESESLVDELKIDKEEQEEEILEEELEAKFWEDLYKEKLEEVLDDKDFKEAAIGDLEYNIEKIQNGDSEDANYIFENISAYKNLEIFKKLSEEKLEQVKDDDNFQESAISNLEYSFQRGQKDNGFYANFAIKNISTYKNLGIFNEIVNKKLEEIKNDENFKQAVINNLEDNIWRGKSNHVSWAMRAISNCQNLGVFEKVVEEKLDEIKGNESFKRLIIIDLENNIQNGQKGDSHSANLVIRTISNYKNISKYYQKLAEEKKAKQARKEDKDENIPKRPEIK